MCSPGSSAWKRCGRSRTATVSLEIEFAYLKLLPREYSGPCHIVSVSQRPDGRCEYEERPRPGPPPPNQAEAQDSNVMRVYLVRAPEGGNQSH